MCSGPGCCCYDEGYEDGLAEGDGKELESVRARVSELENLIADLFRGIATEDDLRLAVRPTYEPLAVSA